MPYETDMRVIEWFERTLGDPRPAIRRRAVELLERVDSASRERWLDDAERDPDPRVATTAVLVRAALSVAEDAGVFELLESDMASDPDASDLSWEWEYRVIVCEGPHVPMASRLVFTRHEDDAAAREIALLMASAGKPVPAREQLMGVIVAKRLVNRYTRSPRTASEAQLWREQGRPRYTERDGG